MTAPVLLIVMPVFNEQASLRKVTLEWFQEIENWTEEFVFLVLDDGSTDGTPRILGRLQEQLGPRLEVVTQPNAGHGPTCLRGYRAAVERGIPFLFQIDSDGQCDPQYFFRFWRERERYDVIYGVRFLRGDGLRRTLAGMILRAVLLAFARVWCIDANVPYRLMRTEAIAKAVLEVPRSFSLANIALAVLLRRAPEVREGTISIHFRERYGGEPTVAVGQFGAKALELIQDLRRLKSPNAT